MMLMNQANLLCIYIMYFDANNLYVGQWVNIFPKVGLNGKSKRNW